VYGVEGGARVGLRYNVVWYGVGQVGWLLEIDTMPKIILETLALLGDMWEEFFPVTTPTFLDGF
jgi:hypothetical protein